jgi:hypothetical protein
MLAVLVALGVAFYEPSSLDDDTFDDFVSETPVSFILALPDSHSSCYRLISQFRSIADFFKDRCHFAVLHHARSKVVRDRFTIAALPALLLFREDRLSAEYLGDTRAVCLLAYLKRVLGPPVILFDAALLRGNGAVAVIQATASPYVKDIFQTVATELIDLLPFAEADGGTAAVQLHRRDDRAVLDFTADFRAAALREWILANRTPRYWAKSAAVWRDVSADDRFAFIAFADLRHSSEELHRTLGAVVAEFGETFTYVYEDINSDKKTITHLGFSGKREPVYCIGRVSDGEIKEKFAFSEHLPSDPDSVVAFVRQFLKMTVRLKSEERLANQAGPLFKLVGSDFADAVADSKLDVVVVILSGKEEGRKAALAAGNATARELQRQNVKTVKVWYLDAALNDTPGFDPGGLRQSTVWLWPAGQQKSAVPFADSENPIAILEQIKKHGKTKLRFRIPRRKAAKDL